MLQKRCSVCCVLQGCWTIPAQHSQHGTTGSFFPKAHSWPRLTLCKCVCQQMTAENNSYGRVPRTEHGHQLWCDPAPRYQSSNLFLLIWQALFEMCFSKNVLQRDGDSCKLGAKECFVFSKTFPLCRRLFYSVLYSLLYPLPQAVSYTKISSSEGINIISSKLRQPVRGGQQGLHFFLPYTWYQDTTKG